MTAKLTGPPTVDEAQWVQVIQELGTEDSVLPLLTEFVANIRGIGEEAAIFIMFREIMAEDHDVISAAMAGILLALARKAISVDATGN